MRLWIDTDIGDNPDDAVALACALAHPRVEVVGISTVSGDVVRRAQLVRDLCTAIGAPTPLVYAGPPDPRALDVADALLAIGPLTNLAALLRHGVELPPTAAMGGVMRPPIHHRGQDVAVDTNFAADPLAAALVVHGARDLLLVPLDVTAPLAVDDGTAAELARAIPPLRAQLDGWDSPLVLHDPAALLALCGEHVAITKRRVAIGVDGSVLDGAAIADPDAVEIDVVTAIDAAACIDRVCELVTSTGPTRPDKPSAEGD